MKNQALFSSKDKSKKLKCCLLQFLFGALRAKPLQTMDTMMKGDRSLRHVLQWREDHVSQWHAILFTLEVLEVFPGKFLVIIIKMIDKKPGL